MTSVAFSTRGGLHTLACFFHTLSSRGREVLGYAELISRAARRILFGAMVRFEGYPSAK
jgi:hypothetical protein